MLAFPYATEVITIYTPHTILGIMNQKYCLIMLCTLIMLLGLPMLASADCSGQNIGNDDIIIKEKTCTVKTFFTDRYGDTYIILVDGNQMVFRNVSSSVMAQLKTVLSSTDITSNVHLIYTENGCDGGCTLLWISVYVDAAIIMVATIGAVVGMFIVGLIFGKILF